MAEIVLEGISKAFGHVQALESFDLVVADGRTVAIVGPSGCGKTTVLRLIAGFEPPDAGMIRIGGDGREWPRLGPGLQARDRLRPAGRWPVPASHRRPEHRLRSCRHEATEARLRDLLDMVSMDADYLAGGRTSCRAASNSESPLPVRLPSSRMSCSLTNRSAHWTPTCAWIPARGAAPARYDRDHCDPRDARPRRRPGFADEVALMDAGRVVRTGPPVVVYS